MAAVVWLVRQTEFNRGRLGAVKVADDVAARLVKKGDALPFDRNLRSRLAEQKAAGGSDSPKRRGRPPKEAAPKVSTKEKSHMENPEPGTRPVDPGAPDPAPAPAPPPAEKPAPAPAPDPVPGQGDTPGEAGAE